MSSKKKMLGIDEVINILSILYRKELEKNNKIREDLQLMQQKIIEEDLSGYENISHSDFLIISDKISRLENNLKNQEIYCDGIFNAREEFLNMM